MNRFRKYNLLKEFNDVRLIHKAIPDRDVGYLMPAAHIYRVQTHHRFLGIGCWKRCARPQVIKPPTYAIVAKYIVENLLTAASYNSKNLTLTT